MMCSRNRPAPKVIEVRRSGWSAGAAAARGVHEERGPRARPRVLPARHHGRARAARVRGRDAFSWCALVLEVFLMMCTYIMARYLMVRHSMVRHLMVRHLMVRCI